MKRDWSMQFSPVYLCRCVRASTTMMRFVRICTCIGMFVRVHAPAGRSVRRSLRRLQLSRPLGPMRRRRTMSGQSVSLYSHSGVDPAKKDDPHRLIKNTAARVYLSALSKFLAVCVCGSGLRPRPR